MNLENQIISVINTSKCDIGIYLKDMNGNEIKYGENKCFEAASCIKVFILIEYFKQVSLGKIKTNLLWKYTKEDDLAGLNSGIISTLDYGVNLTTKDYATLMIIYSDNIATNKLIDYLGIDNINKTIKSLGFKNTYLFNKLDLMKYHKFGQTTPYEYAKVYDLLLKNKIINKEVSSNCLSILKKQQSNDMITKYLPALDLIMKNTVESNINFIASKSGTIIWEGTEMKNTRIDGGIISTKYGDYIISIFISNLDDLRYNQDNEGIIIGGKISELAFKNFIINKGEFK